jgi:cytidylate kinase
MAEKLGTMLPPRVEQRISTQLALAERMKAKTGGKAGHAPFVTISRQYGCDAMELAEQLSVRLDRTESLAPGNWQVYNRQIIDEVSQELHLTGRLLEALDVRTRGGIEEFFATLIAQSPPDIEILHHLVHVVRAIALHGRCIVVGRGGSVLTRDLPGGIHVRLTAPEDWRLESLINRFGWDKSKARGLLQEEESHRQTFFQKYLGHDVSDPCLYDLTMNVARLSLDEQLDAILSVFRRRHTTGASSPGITNIRGETA